MIDSNIKNHGEVEYDKENCVQRGKIQSGRKIRIEGYRLLPLNKNRSITIKFPTRTLLKMIHSSIKSRGEVEYDKQS